MNEELLAPIEEVEDGNIEAEDIGPARTQSQPRSQERKFLSAEDAAHLFSTRDELLNAKPLGFFIQDFLPDDGATGLGGPTGERKSLIAQNITWSLLTGEPLFGHFKVVKQPSRVLYLVPELSRTSLKEAA